MSKEIKWPLSKKLWQRLHGIFNRLAWRYANPGGPDWGKALRIDKTHPLWRLNDWAANHYTKWYIEQVTGHKFPKDDIK